MQTITDNQINRLSRRQRRRQAMRQGQTIVVALLVLLLLGFIGGLFASIVTRNLTNAGRSNRVETADYYAEAGARFADDQLTQSTDGADWRPPLQYQIANVPKDQVGSARYAAAVTALNLPLVSPNDPDSAYLAQGFTRYNIGTGRFLLRLTYDPAGLNSVSQTAGSDPRARYIKIEIVGREGTVDPTDPTTYVNQPPVRLAATLVEYKAIGITDYARFETNPDKRADIMALGVASAQYVSDFTNSATPTLARYPLVTTYGAPDAYLASGTAPNQTLTPNPMAGSATAAANAVPGGGSIQANGTVRFYGQNFMYLNNSANYMNVSTPPTYPNSNQNAGSFGENAVVAGNLLLDNYTPPSTTGTVQSLADESSALVVVNPQMPATAPAADDYVSPSNAPPATPFDTHGGQVRDGGSGTDANGLPRNANRLEPPSLDTVNPATNLTRYKDIATNAVGRQSFDAQTATGYGTAANPTVYSTGAQYGYGRQGIYVNNTGDTQSESTGIVGGYTLVDEWLHRTASGQGRAAWAGNFYRPPGVDIVLGRQQIISQASETANGTVKTFYGVRLTRSDVDASGAPVGWKNPDGSPITTPNVDGNTASTMFVSYTSLNASNPPATTSGTAYTNNPSNDVVIYAEGNVRVRGTVSAPASGATASDEMDAIDKLPRHVTIVTNGTAYIDGSLLRGSAQSSIAVLAHDYVCVNTTQFLAGAQPDINPTGTTPPGPYTGDPNLLALDFSTSDEVLLQEFQYVTPTATGTNGPSLYISGGPSAPGNASADFDLINSATGVSLVKTATINTLFQAPYPVTFTSTGITNGTTLEAGGSGLVHTTFPLSGTTAITNAAPVPGELLILAVRRNPGSDQSISTQDFLLERAAILPADIDIEAVLFAQTKSFFIIPGPSFNTSTDDNLTNFTDPAKSTTGLVRPSLTGLTSGTNEYDNRRRYPFYGQPIDMKITIRGSVSEARPADIDAQTAWMENWGWIPKLHGSLDTEPSNRAAINVSPTQASAPIGLTFLYNPQAGYPYIADTTTPANDIYLRTDIYGRPLPYAPKMPVCAGLLYTGQNSADQPILQ